MCASPEAIDDLANLTARARTIVRAAFEAHLRHQPALESKSRIKRLRRIRRPQYRLRVDEIRIFYDIREQAVEVVAIVPKSQAAAWLERVGEKE